MHVKFEDIGVKVYYPKISFKCSPELECGICCKIAPADLSEDEYLRLVEAGYRRFAYRVDYGVYQMLRKEGCIFLDGYRCKIYELRPASCRAFPFIPAFFDFHERCLVVVFDPKALEFCKGVGKGGEMDLDIVYECAKACRKIFADRVRVFADFKDLLDAFLLAALSTPKKAGMIVGSPWRTQCYCCGYPLVISDVFEIYREELKRDYEDFGNYLVCERCLGDNPEDVRQRLLFNSDIRKIAEDLIKQKC